MDKKPGVRSFQKYAVFFCGHCHADGIQLIQYTFPYPPQWRFVSKFHLLEGHTMETKLNTIDLMAKEIKDTLADFMLNHSRIEPVRYEEVCYFTPEGGHSYDYLDDAGRKVQSALLKRYGRFYSKLHPLLKDQSDDVLSKMSQLNEVLMRTIEHKLTWCENTKEALHLALVALEDQLKLVKAIYEEKSRKD
jgi:hypothetical protein